LGEEIARWECRFIAGRRCFVLELRSERGCVAVLIIPWHPIDDVNLEPSLDPV
jgi:hypothetical protein